MSKKKHKQKKKAKCYHPESQRQLKSSWGAAVQSCVKEHYLNVRGSHFIDCYEDDLSEEGLRKKDLITGPRFILLAVLLGLLPVWVWEDILQWPAAERIIVVIILEAAAVGIGIFGLRIIVDAVRRKPR